MLKRLAEDVTLAITFATRLPLPVGWITPDRKLAQAFWALPLAGAIVGLAGAALALFCNRFGGLDATFAAIAATAAMVMLTGALHEDGLADFCDGIGGGDTREQRLAIMRDSSIGTYGAVAMVLALMSQTALLDELLVRLSNREFLLAVALTAAMSRTAIALPFAVLAPARNNGLARTYGTPAVISLLVGLAWPAATIGICLGKIGLAALAGTLAAATIVTAIAARYLGGHTGDVFGATIVVGFVSGLLGIRILVP